MKLVLAEILKLRGSTSWAVVVLLPVASVVSACIFVRPDGWRLLWIRSVGFYGMALLPVGLAVLASLVWRVEHRGSNWNVLMSTPVPTWRTVVAKTAAIWLLASGMQLVLVLAVTAVGVGALGLPGAPPGLCLAAGALTAVACAPACALQSAISAFTRSFALPVAAGLCLTGVGTTMLLAHVPGIWLLPHALVTRTTKIGALERGSATGFTVQDLTWGSAAATVGTAAILTGIVIAATTLALNRTDARN